jgi:phage tail protein X
MTTYRTSSGDILDDLCWRHYGRQAGAVEAVLDANPGLADLGPVYPAGVLIDLPDLAVPAAPGPVRLWE